MTESLQVALTALVWAVVNAGVGAGVTEAVLEAKPLGWLRSLIERMDADLRDCAFCLSHWSVVAACLAETLAFGSAALSAWLVIPFSWRLSHALHDAQRWVFTARALADFRLQEEMHSRMSDS